MSTRSYIAIKKGNTIKGIYCHWDGYPENNGVILHDYYKDVEKIEKLISLGDISSLNKDVEPNPNEKHDFENPQKDVVIAYHRDRGEEYKTPVEKPILQFLRDVEDSWAEYVYIYDVSKLEWIYAPINYCYLLDVNKLGAFKPLDWEVEKIKEREKNGE